MPSNNKWYKKEGYLDEAALIAGGSGITYSGSQYIKLRKELFKNYTKNAFSLSGKPFSRKGYKRFTDSYLKNINTLRSSPHSHYRGKAIDIDLKHFSPKYLSKDSKALFKGTKQYKNLRNLNKASFKKIAPKRFAKIGVGIGFALGVPAAVEYKQRNKAWRENLKKNALTYGAPIVTPFVGYKLYKYARRLK